MTNRPILDQLVNALLYEGYLLYPYRRAVKNRQRWSFGGLYPLWYTKDRVGADTSMMRTQCLVTGDERLRLTVTIRFLQLIERQVGHFDRPSTEWPTVDNHPVRFVESLEVDGEAVHSWQEAIEREIPLEAVDVAAEALASRPRKLDFAFGPGSEREPVRDASGRVVGVVERRQAHVEGTLELSAEPVGSHVYRLTAQVENRTTEADASAIVTSENRDEALRHAMISTHTMLEACDGKFVSLLEPPDELRELAAGCRNVGAWPVLVGRAGERDTMLSSPIILYDYPQIAPESPGDLFDATEIDEILTLRIMTLSDEEKKTMAELDARGRALLERTEALARGQLMALHGTMREVRPTVGGPNHGTLGSDR